MGRHEADRKSLTRFVTSPISALGRKVGLNSAMHLFQSRKVWGWAFCASLTLVTVVDPYSGTLSAQASEFDAINYFDSANEPTVTVELTRGGYEVVSGAAAGKVFVELAAIPGRNSVQAIAYNKMADFNWGREQYSCLVKLWERESNWRINAYNSGSGAYGIPQALPGNKMATAGPDWMTNPETQINWGLNYIKGRYSNPCSALAHSDAHRWY